MFPGMNMNSAQMKQAMKKMGVSQDELDAQKVVIVLADKELVFEKPSVSKVKMMGQETFQIAGPYHEQSKDAALDISDADIETVMQQTHCTKEQALAALTDAKGDLAEAILNISE